MYVVTGGINTRHQRLISGVGTNIRSQNISTKDTAVRLHCGAVHHKYAVADKDV